MLNFLLKTLKMIVKRRLFKYLPILLILQNDVFESKSLCQDSLSFNACIAIGLEQNYNMKIVRNQEKIANNNYTFGLLNMLPDLNVRSTINYAIIDSRQKRFSGEIQERDNARTNSQNTSIALEWTIFDGFGMFVGYKKLNEILEMGKLTTRMAVEDLIGTIGTAYYNYLRQQKRLNTLNYVMELSKERLRITEEKYRIGYASKLDFQQALVEYHTDSSLYLQQIQALENSRIQLNRVLALSPDTVLTIEDSIIVDYKIIFEDLINQTLNNNSNLLIAKQKQSISALDMKLINSRMYPVISLNGGYTFTRSEAQAGILLENNQKGWNYGATLTLPIFNGFDLQRQRKNARIEIENSKLNYENLEQDIIATLNEVFMIYQNSLRLIELEKQNLSIAYDNFDIAMERFRIGNLSGIEMREIERIYLDAEDRLLTAQYQAKLAEISLKQISGRMQEYL
jgi:outer membrane protein TolC